jgi:hypothetical protein
MSRRFTLLLFLVGAAVLGAAGAQQPHVTNGAVTTAQAATPFLPSFRSLVASAPDVTWIGYAVPIVDGERVMCCFGSDSYVNGTVSGSSMCCTGCRLETSPGPATTTPQAAPAGGSGVVKLEGPTRMLVLYRIANHAIDRVRVFSEDCQLDAGGRPMRWLENVRPADSIALLTSLITEAAEPTKGRITDGAITAIAMHADAAADAALERLVAPPNADAIRKKVTFWLGNARGRRGYDVLRRVLRDDPSTEVRKGAVFGLSQSPIPEAVDALINIARTDADPRLRGESLFWLAQKAGNKAAATIADRIDQDPDTEVKKKAVFALSQLPKEEGVPLLINVARTNRNPEVRKQAMFWLGQSKDARATEFFADVLRK